MCGKYSVNGGLTPDVYVCGEFWYSSLKRELSMLCIPREAKKDVIEGTVTSSLKAPIAITCSLSVIQLVMNK